MRSFQNGIRNYSNIIFDILSQVSSTLTRSDSFLSQPSFILNSLQQLLIDLVMNLSTFSEQPQFFATSSSLNKAFTAAFLCFYLSFFSNSLFNISIMCVFYSSLRLACSSSIYCKSCVYCSSPLFSEESVGCIFPVAGNFSWDELFSIDI